MLAFPPAASQFSVIKLAFFFFIFIIRNWKASWTSLENEMYEADVRIQEKYFTDTLYVGRHQTPFESPSQTGPGKKMLYLDQSFILTT